MKPHRFFLALALLACLLVGSGGVPLRGVEPNKTVAQTATRRNGKAGWRKHMIDAKQSAYDMCAADMDRDGDLDLVVAGAESNNVVWLENPSR